MISRGHVIRYGSANVKLCTVWGGNKECLCLRGRIDDRNCFIAYGPKCAAGLIVLIWSIFAPD